MVIIELTIDVVNTENKRMKLSERIMYIIQGEIKDNIVTMITFIYTLFMNLRIDNFTIFRRNNRRANKHICDIIIATITVTSGKIFLLKR